MKLSAAIRIGSMTTRKIIGILNDGKNGRCALGAAADACGYKWVGGYPQGAYDFLRKTFPILNTYTYRSFIDLRQDTSILQKIYVLNDTGSMTREQIADWIEQIEIEYEKKEQSKKTKMEVIV